MKKRTRNYSPGLRRYMVKAPHAHKLLSTELFTYPEAERAAARLGGIVTNRSFAQSRGMLAEAAR
ncbi:hypothetical protein [Oleiharenicola sp. Vm1]|uniref:hypothetical protein n=1 Tax=Oleiharenicola sp. Vm1 TaxID=3398393 RepID=UPI0039F56282